MCAEPTSFLAPECCHHPENFSTPLVFTVSGSCVSVQHALPAYFSCTRMHISRDAHDTPPRVQHFPQLLDSLL